MEDVDHTRVTARLSTTEESALVGQMLSNLVKPDMFETIDICTSRHTFFQNSVNKGKKDKIDQYLASSGRRFSWDSYADLCRFVDDKKIEHSVKSDGNSGICTKSVFVNKDKLFFNMLSTVPGNSPASAHYCQSFHIVSQDDFVAATPSVASSS